MQRKKQEKNQNAENEERKAAEKSSSRVLDDQLVSARLYKDWKVENTRRPKWSFRPISCGLYAYLFSQMRRGHTKWVCAIVSDYHYNKEMPSLI